MPNINIAFCSGARRPTTKERGTPGDQRKREPTRKRVLRTNPQARPAQRTLKPAISQRTVRAKRRRRKAPTARKAPKATRKAPKATRKVQTTRKSLLKRKRHQRRSGPGSLARILLASQRIAQTLTLPAAAAALHLP